MRNDILKMICAERGYIDNSPVSTQSFISLMIRNYILGLNEIPNTIVLDLDILNNDIKEFKFYDSDTNENVFTTNINGELFSGMQVDSEVISSVTNKEKVFLPLYLQYEIYDNIYLYSHLRTLNNKMLFVFSGIIPSKQIDKSNLLIKFKEKHRENALFLNNHQCYYTRLFNGEEIEFKYTLPNNTDIWTLNQEFYNEVESNSIPFYIPEFGDEFQLWDYENYLYEISYPIDEAGYISFIPLTKGGYTIKRKWFIDDSLKRKEEHYQISGEIDNFNDYIKERFGVTGKELPSFQRIRYDVNFESLLTGHVFGVFFDYSYTHSDESKALCQCELEYIRTRSIKDFDENEMLAQFNELANYLDDFFAKRNIQTKRGVYSKLSFLKEINEVKRNG